MHWALFVFYLRLRSHKQAGNPVEVFLLKRRVIVVLPAPDSKTWLVHTVRRGAALGWTLLEVMVWQRHNKWPEKHQLHFLWEFTARSSPDPPAEGAQQHLLHLPLFPAFPEELLLPIQLPSWRQVRLWSKQRIWVSHSTVLEYSQVKAVHTMNYVFSWVYTEINHRSDFMLIL